MEVSQNLKHFITQNKELVLAVEQDPDKANKLMSELEDRTRSYGIDFYYEALNLFKELYGINEFVSYVDALPVGFYRAEDFSTINIPKNIEIITSQSISGCTISTLNIDAKDTVIYSYGIKNCTIDTLTFNDSIKMYKNSLYQCKIKSWEILGDLTVKGFPRTFKEYVKYYKNCRFIIKNSTELIFEDINFSVDLVTYLEEDIEAKNIKIV